jgi:hypothetical protein
MTGGGRRCASRRETQQYLHDLVNTACVQPAAYLLVDDRLGRQIVWRHAPMHPRFDDIAHTSEDVTQVVKALAGGFRQQRQIGCNERPFVVAHISWMEGARGNLPAPTTLQRQVFIRL